jgi:murein DD-endopeptidase MepM/ murein hydrolase activator NlpD
MKRTIPSHHPFWHGFFVIAALVMVLHGFAAQAMPLDRAAAMRKPNANFIPLQGKNIRPAQASAEFISLASYRIARPAKAQPALTLAKDETEKAELKTAKPHAAGLRIARAPFKPLPPRAFKAAKHSQLAALPAVYRQPSHRGHIWPVDASVPQRVSSPFGYRIHPITQRPAFHKGIDIAAPVGTAVLASADGVVTQTGYLNNLGKSVRLDFKDGTYAYYGHLSRITVTEGQRVKQGQKLGAIGSTGRSTGPHLDYSLRINDKPVNPLPYLPEPPAIRLASR